MRYLGLSLSILSVVTLSAAPPVKPEATLVAQATALYQSKAVVMPATPADLVKLQQEGDANLAVRTLTGRWLADRLAQAQLPDEYLLQRVLEGFSWDEAGVLQLHTAGLDTNLMRMLAQAKPLGLATEAQERLSKEGVDPATVASLAKKPMGALPPMKSMADFAMAALANDPVLGSPAFKAQLDDQRKKIEKGMSKQFQSGSFKLEIWDRTLESWRSQIQVGADSRNLLAQAGTEIVDAAPEAPESMMPGMFGAAKTGNDLFLKSTPLGAALVVGDIVSVLKTRTMALIRVKDPNEVYSFRLEDTTCFTTRRKPAELALVRLQEGEGAPTARLTKGVYFGRDFKPADEPVPVDIAQEGEVWAVRPKSRLAPGPYAFLLGGKNLQFMPFIVK